MPEGFHEFIGARRGKSRCENGFEVFKIAAPFEPAFGFADRLARRFFEIGAAVSIHIDFSDVARNSRLFEFFHEDDRRIGMERPERNDARRAVGDEFAREFGVDGAGVIGIAETRFGFECVGIEPIEQRQIHTHAEHGVLRSVEVHIAERWRDELVGHIDSFAMAPFGWQIFSDIGDDVVVEGDVAIFKDFEFSEFGGMNDVSMEDFDHGLAPYAIE